MEFDAFIKKSNKKIKNKKFRLKVIDWLFLAILGVSMALASMFMDNMIEYLQTCKFYYKH
jgi:hypothetical protein